MGLQLQVNSRQAKKKGGSEVTPIYKDFPVTSPVSSTQSSSLVTDSDYSTPSSGKRVRGTMRDSRGRRVRPNKRRKGYTVTGNEIWNEVCLCSYPNMPGAYCVHRITIQGIPHRLGTQCVHVFFFIIVESSKFGLSVGSPVFSDNELYKERGNHEASFSL